MVREGKELLVANKEMGQQLRGARLSKSLTIDEVAVRLRIPPKYLRALEKGKLSEFSAEVYAKGAFKKYATFLGVQEQGLWHIFLRSLAGVRKNKPLQLPVPATWLQRVLRPTGIFIVALGLTVVAVATYIGGQVKSFVSVPELALLEPHNSIIRGDELIVKGKTEEDAEVKVNGEVVLLDTDNQFSIVLPVDAGINVLHIEAKGASGRINEITKHVLVPRD